MFKSPRSKVAAASAAVAASLVFHSTADADLFGVTVDAPGLLPVTVTGDSLFDLAENVIDSAGDFEQFEGTSFTGSLDYANLSNAIIVSGDALNPDAVRLQIPSIGFDRIFDDEDEAEEFLQNEGADTLARFIAVVNEQTLVGVTDGNPAALTAILADDAFRNYGEFRNPFVGYTQGGDATRLYGSAAFIDTDVGEGVLYEGAFSGAIGLTDHVAISLSIPGAVRDIEGSQTFFVGAQLGVPIKFTPATGPDQPFLWQVTPYALASGGGSQDQLAGGIVLGGGAVNLVGIKIGDFSITSGQQAVGYGGTPIEAGDFRFETDVGQTLLRGSLQATYGGTGSAAYITGGVAYTRFLDDAAVDDYVSPLAGIGLKFGRGNVLRVGYRGDIGDGFDMHRGELELRFSF
ncbi:MAG: hypothetical protein AAGI46_11485 [Planctomycetota bacterium]